MFFLELPRELLFGLLTDWRVFRQEDQGKIRLAVGLRRIDPADVPATAKGHGSLPGLSSTPSSSQPRPEASALAPGPSQKKRKAAFEAAMITQPSASQPSASQPLRRLSDQFEEEQNNAVIDVDDAQDELYCMTKVPVVGLQYYTGELNHCEGEADTRLKQNRARRHRRGSTARPGAAQ